MRSSIKLVAVVSVAALALAACGSKTPDTTAGATTAPSGSSTTATGAAFKACMVLDTGGVDDRSFNQSSWAGLQAANKTNPKIAISYIAQRYLGDFVPLCRGRK